METRKIILMIFVAFIVLSCSQSTKTKKEEKNKVNKEDIIDAWGNDENENAIFAFYDDSIYYPDPNNWYRYEMHNDTILIFQEDNYILRLVVKSIDSDSMTLENLNYGVTHTYERRK
jgi:hypothetical protein